VPLARIPYTRTHRTIRLKFQNESFSFLLTISLLLINTLRSDIVWNLKPTCSPRLGTVESYCRSALSAIGRTISLPHGWWWAMEVTTVPSLLDLSSRAKHGRNVGSCWIDIAIA